MPAALATRARFAVATLVACLLLPGLAQAAGASSPQQDVQQADQLVQQATRALQAGDAAGASQFFDQYRATWRQIENGVKDTDPDAYASLETAQREVRASFLAQPMDPTRTAAALDGLHAADQSFIATDQASQASARPQPANDSERLNALIADLDSAQARIQRGDPSGAQGIMNAFQQDWFAVETTVKAKSPSAYTATEDDAALVEAMLSGPTPRLDEADKVLSEMGARLAPLAASGASYGVFDAFVIILREGLEALLVVGALVAFLNRSGNREKQPWIWGGAGLGVGLSIVLAVFLQQLFSRAGAGLGSELVEGMVGVAAAVMLFYMSYWLHAKSRLGAWQSYIHQRSARALAAGSVLSLAAIALLAVFREGAEAAVFYLGIAPSIATGDLVLGLGLGVLALSAVAAAVLLVGLRLPLRPFFLASSALIYYLGFKFLGTGLHSLQVAGVIPASPVPLPSSDVIGFYPTWQTVLPQMMLLLVAAAVLWLAQSKPALYGKRSSATVENAGPSSLG
jgi:high-affinity iron transporter